jgi:hypothetical protein
MTSARETVSWQQFLDDAPEFAAAVQARFTIRKHATMATLRRDGSPRISGTEVEFAGGHLSLGSMPGAMKARDLRRDPRLALHSPTEDPPSSAPSDWSGEAKIAGLAVEISDAARDDEPHRFQVMVAEVVLTRVAQDGEHLVIQSWHPGRGLEEVRRR